MSAGTGGSAGLWDAELYDGRHAFVWRAASDLVEVLAPQPGERVLDLGCGTGHLGAAIAERGAEVLGLDSSPEMVGRARAAYPGLRFEVGDARHFELESPVDAVFSNATLHWVKEPRAVLERVVGALVPGGRFVAEFGGSGNVAAIRGALHGALAAAGDADSWARDPWYFPRLGEYASLLEEAGLRVTFAAHFDRPTPLEGGEAGLRGWLEMFAGGLMGGLDPAAREAVVGEVEARLSPVLWRDGAWVADYARLRVVAVKEAGAPGRG